MIVPISSFHRKWVMCMDTVIHLRTARVAGTYSHTGMMPNKSNCTNYTAEITQRWYTVNPRLTTERMCEESLKSVGLHLATLTCAGNP